MDEMDTHDVRTVSISTGTAEWASIVAKTTDKSVSEVIEQCCRHGLVDYESALELENNR